MAQKSALEKILDKNRVELGQLQKKSMLWFNSQAESMKRVSRTPSSLMRGDQKKKFNDIMPGRMYMYMYDPKHKETLPYYDTFPLVFPFNQVDGGFYGLNLHYLPYSYRATLLSRLMTFHSDNRYDEKTRLKFSWQFIGNMSRFAIAKPCVKHYLYKHVRTPFKQIDSSDWATAMLIPMEQFQKQSMQEVWKQSLEKAR